MVGVRRGAARELSGLGSTWNFTNKLAIKCLIVNDKSRCFRGAKALCYLTQPCGRWTSPCAASRSLSGHCLSRGPPGGKRASLGPSPFLLNSSDLSCLILKTPHYVDPPVWASLSCTSSPKGPQPPCDELQCQVLGKTCALWSSLSSAEQNLVTCHMEKKNNLFIF